MKRWTIAVAMACACACAVQADGTVRVDVLADGLFRVRRAKTDGSWPESCLNRYGILEANWPAVTSFRGDGAAGETAAASYRVDAKTGTVRFASRVSPAAFTVDLARAGAGFAIRFGLEPGERIYGLGDASRRNLQRRPGRYPIVVANNESNIPIPMALSSRGWGMLLNSTWMNAFDVGLKDPNAMICEAAEGDADVYVFFGKDYRALLDVYTRLAGRSALLPAFGYGFSFVCNQHVDQFNLVNDAVRFRECDLPCDILGLEPGWMSKFYDRSTHKRFDRSKFSFPFWAPDGSFTWPKALNRLGFNLSLWLCCDYDLTRYEEQCAKGEKPRSRAEKARSGADGARKDLAWKDVRITGEVDAKKKFPWGISGMEVIERGVEDDYDEGELPWFWHLWKFVDRGARCFKLDGANQLNPSRRTWANGRKHEEVKNLYPVIYAKQMGRGYEDYTGRRAMVYSSGGYAGVQRYVATWAGDTGGGTGSLMSILNLAASGHSNQSCDMDADNPASLHYGFLQPWSQANNWDAWCMPWTYPKKTLDALRGYARLRYRLLPYLYGAAAEAARTGWPMMRMLPLEYPDDPKYDAVHTTYLLGDQLLVSVFTNRTVVPPGARHAWRTDERVEGPCERVEELSDSWGGGLYAKAGAIVPTWPARNSISRGWSDEVIFEVWPSADGTAELYEDDGDSLGYRKGECARTALAVKTADGVTVFTVGPRRGAFKGMPATRRMKANFHFADGVRSADLGDVGAAGKTVRVIAGGRRAGAPNDEWRSVPVDRVKLGGVLGHRVDLTVRANFMKLDLEKSFFRPFREKTSREGFVGLGKLLDAAVFLAKHDGGRDVIARKDEIASAIAATQDADGYAGFLAKDSRLRNLWDLHEIGFILQGLVSDYEEFGSVRSLGVAKRAADWVMANWKNLGSGWEWKDITDRETTLGLAHGFLRLASAAGERKYLDFACNERALRDWSQPIVRGRHGLIYGQAYGHLGTALEQLELYGREADDRLLANARRALAFMTRGDGLLVDGTGGVAECWTDDQDGEGFVGETCFVAFQYLFYDRLLRLGKGDAAQLGDLMERLAYNALPAAQGRDGRRLRYYTPLNGAREFYGSDAYCCPNNFRRAMGRLPGYVYYEKDGAVLANLFAESRARLDVGSTWLTLSCRTDYPTGGKVRWTVDPEEPAQFAFKLRLPGWCAKPSVKVNGAAVRYPMRPGEILSLPRRWRRGDVVEADFPMEVRCVRGRKRQSGRFAVMRGPQLYALDARTVKGCEKKHPLDAAWYYALSPSEIASTAPVADSAARPGGTAIPVRVAPDWAYALDASSPRARLTEFADENACQTYFRALDPEDPALTDDPLFVDGK